MSDSTPEEGAPHFDSLKQLRDEIRLKVHLAHLDVKEKWQELEQQLESLEQRMGGNGTFVDATAQLGRDLKQSLLDFRQRLGNS